MGGADNQHWREKNKGRLKTDRPPKEARKSDQISILLMLWLRISASEGERVLHKGILTWRGGSNGDLLDPRQSVTSQSAAPLTSDGSIFRDGFLILWAVTVTVYSGDMREADSGDEHDWRASVEICSDVSFCSVKPTTRWSPHVKLVHRPASRSLTLHIILWNWFCGAGLSQISKELGATRENNHNPRPIGTS